MKKAVILLSGGLDSTTCLAVAKEDGYICHALSFAYGQRYSAEVNAAKRIAAACQVEHHQIINIDIGKLGGSALTDANIAVPDYTGDTEIPVTYVPARNTVFLAYALSYAEVIDADAIYIGVNAIDYSGYPDCRPEYIAAFQKMANLATKRSVEGNPIIIKTPLLNLTKADIIKLGVSLDVNYAVTVTCYQATAEGLACGHCDSCHYRREGFVKAGVVDPTRYVTTVTS